MRSKWLDWTPETGSVGFDGSPSPVPAITRISEEAEPPASSVSPDAVIREVARDEPTKPTELTAAPCSDQPAERPSYFWGRHRDAYGWRAHVALEAMCRIPSPEGLLVWLRDRSPYLHQKLARDLPDEISRAWNAKVPYAEFDAVWTELIDTYRRGIQLYQEFRSFEGSSSRSPNAGSGPLGGGAKRN